MDLATNRRLTTAFIAQYPTTLVLVPREKVKKPAGGFVWQEKAPRAPQVVTLIEQGTVGGQPKPVVTADGIERVVEFELLGEWDASVAVFDVFSHQGRDWEVVGMFYDNGYEVRALVSARG